MENYESFLKRSPLYSALILENLFSAKKRRMVIKTTKLLIFSIPIIITLSIILSSYGLLFSTTFANLLIPKLLGLTLISLGIFLTMEAFEAYFASTYYFEYIGKNNYNNKDPYTFSAGRIFRRIEKNNILIGFLKSTGVGRKILLRLGINEEEINLLLMKQAEITNPPIFKPENIPLVKVSHLVNFIYANYPDFRNLLTNHGLKQKDLEETTAWAIYNVEKQEYDRRWWTEEKMARIPGLATDWSFGRTYLLNKYSRNILLDKEVNSDAIVLSGRNRELEQVEAVLERNSGANIMLVGAPGQEKMEVIWNLSRKIRNKTAPANLLNKKPLLFLTGSFASTIKDKNDFEDKLTIILSEALQAGNIILVIDNYPKLILQAKQFDLKLTEIIEPYLASNHDQIIALADTEYYHNLIEPDPITMSHFETVTTKALLPDEIVRIISREAIEVEEEYEVLFTYPAILEIARSAEYYFPGGVSADKAQDLLAEISPWAVERDYEVLGRQEVLEYIGKKTDVPVSIISTDEKDKLLDLENLIGKRVVAQREAVFSVSNAIRRNRAGIRNEKRPLGSFLFLGPTGVGKTETAKALAEVLFGDENLLMRLDMSEYQNSEALARLIGSQQNNTQGILANMLREHPYGVLLLDEFEKTNKDVLNLFLQIIDEGYFTDVFGKKVIARNIMFIATSNAGAEKIFEMVSAGKNMRENESEIISYIIKQDIFKPELINRFDATILFHPLSKEDLAEIARLMLAKITKKLEEKGIILSLNKELINFVTEKGYNLTFGARPMNRLIQDTVEQHLADLIIREQLNPGQTVEFTVIGNGDTKNDLLPKIK